MKYGNNDALLRITPVDERWLTIDVLDSGPGIPAAELDAVLQPFYRLETSRNRHTGGTGVGLAIASQLAARLRGRLTLSNRPQGGLEARLWLPLYPDVSRADTDK